MSPDSVDKSTWDLREDGTEKGNGFLGILQRPDGTVSSEISVGVEIGGREIDIPTLVPTLTKDEVNYLLNMDMNTGKIPDSIMQKAIDHAEMRLSQGKSVFAQPGLDY